MRELSNITCTDLYDSVEWFHLQNSFTLFILIVINIITLVGNSMVIMAIICTSKLRTVMYAFVANLAFADLMVSLMVLPFSAIREVYKVWLFGQIWCSIWLAIDVWMCTASILNLCVISLDRYLAVHKPFSYPQLMTSKRTIMLLAGVWIFSFLICFPPLVGWKNEQVQPDYDMNLLSDPFNTTTTTPVTMKPCQWICHLNNNRSYVVYSALGSFFIPMLVMLFFYWQIYNIAYDVEKSVKQGFQKTNRKNGEEITLRIHCGRGRGCNSNRDNARNSSNTSISKSSESSSVKQQEKFQIPNFIPTIEIVNEKINNLEITPSAPSQVPVNYNNGQTQLELCLTPQSMNLKVDTIINIDNNKRRKSLESYEGGDELSLHETASPSNLKIMQKLTKNIKSHVKKLRVETKAAKTLGIIIGCFIFCWLPFFTVYLIHAFYPNFINQTVFSVLFWLGYCNSGINPFIYGFYNRDFRRAFKKILCGKWSFMKNIKKKSQCGNNTNQLPMRNYQHLNCFNHEDQQKNLEESDPEMELKVIDHHNEFKV